MNWKACKSCRTLHFEPIQLFHFSPKLFRLTLSCPVTSSHQFMSTTGVLDLCLSELKDSSSILKRVPRLMKAICCLKNSPDLEAVFDWYIKSVPWNRYRLNTSGLHLRRFHKAYSHIRGEGKQKFPFEKINFFFFCVKILHDRFLSFLRNFGFFSHSLPTHIPSMFALKKNLIFISFRSKSFFCAALIFLLHFLTSFFGSYKCRSSCYYFDLEIS